MFNKGKSLLISKLPTQLFSCGNSFSNMNVCLPLELFYLGTNAHKLRIRLECNAIIPWTVHDMKHYQYSLSQTHSFSAIFWKVSCIGSGVSRNRDPCPIYPHPQDIRVFRHHYWYGCVGNESRMFAGRGMLLVLSIGHTVCHKCHRTQ